MAQPLMLSAVGAACYELISISLMSGLLSLLVDVVGGTWLQLMCCTLPKGLCP